MRRSDLDDDDDDDGGRAMNNPHRWRGEIEVDVIIPVHNAAKTLVEAVESAMFQIIPADADPVDDDDDDDRVLLSSHRVMIHVCCYDDGSTDGSWSLLQDLQRRYHHHHNNNNNNHNSDGVAVDHHHHQATTTTTTSDQGPPPGHLPHHPIPTRLWIGRGEVSRGAGAARNCAVALRSTAPLPTSLPLPAPPQQQQQQQQQYLCFLDSDDVMHPTRVARQLRCFLQIPDPADRHGLLLGGNFVRDPPQATWHYTQWANSLTPERLRLERFREVTVLQPTWMMTRNRFDQLGGYLEAPLSSSSSEGPVDWIQYIQEWQRNHPQSLCLIHPAVESRATLRLAEDLRLFHAHLYQDGRLQVIHTDPPLVTYRHGGATAGTSQSSQTPRPLLLYLRARAWEEAILRRDPRWSSGWAIWGAGRDGKQFLAALSPEVRKTVTCLVDVDPRKIQAGYYVQRDDPNVRIPILHFGHLAVDPVIKRDLLSGAGPTPPRERFGRITKSRPAAAAAASIDRPPPKRPKPSSTTVTGNSSSTPDAAAGLDEQVLSQLPVVVCVAMYRTGGALEENVRLIGRTEGVNLWHFS